jgi:hypothetical protein
LAPGEGPFPNYSDYASSPFPNWPVATWHCLPDAGQLIKKQAEVFKYWHILPTIKSAVADNCERDIETAQSFLSGLGLPDFDLLVEESLFNPFPSVCAFRRRRVASLAFVHPFFRSSAERRFLRLCAAASRIVRAAASEQRAADE